MARIALLLISTLVLSGAALAELSIDRAIIQFESGKSPRQDVAARNTGSSNLFLEVEVLEVHNPGTEEEHRQVVRDPESVGLVAAPRRLMVPPGGARPIRLINLNGHGDQEKVYRVNIKPVLPPAQTEGMGVRIVIAYQVLVFIAPENIRTDLQSRREGSDLVITNQGNVNVMLSNGEQCPIPNPGTCQEVPGRRIYPGGSYRVTLTDTGPVEFDVEAAGVRNRQRF